MNAQWIQPKQTNHYEEPVLALADMFSGKIPESPAVESRLNPVCHLKRCFQLENKPIKKASLTITAHGLYQAKINGQCVTEALLTPDFTSYHHYLQYQTYDVTHLLKQKNTWTVLLADGWYAGRISVNGGNHQFGEKLALLAELVIQYRDGSTQCIATDEKFVAKKSHYTYSDLFIGEKQDLRLYDEEWLVNNDYQNCEPVEVVDLPLENLVAQKGPQVKIMERLSPAKMWQEEQATIIDFGQVIAGFVEMNLFLNEGQEIILDHSETLDEDGKFFHNIVGRNKDQRDIFIGRGQKEHLQPTFTYHGFRYVKISGLTQKLAADEIKACVIYSEMKQTGYLNTNQPKINQLLNNVLWSQKGNMVSIPTDCPQREKMGWTGDMQVFAPTATFFMDVYAFISRWLDNVRLEQQENGEICDFTPAPKDFFEAPSLTGSYSSAGWGDAIILVPWILYQRYGKLDILKENYEAMIRWHQYSVQSSKANKTDDTQYLWDTKFHYGDWMFPSFMMGPDAKGPIATSQVTKDIFGTAFLAHSSYLLAEIAQLLGDKKQENNARAYYQKVKESFNKYFMAGTKLTSDYQGCYVIGLAFHLFHPQNEQLALQRLKELIIQNHYKLDTGFLSVPYLLDCLVDHHEDELARKILFQEDCPSWLYEINHGATTIWESWAGIQPDGTVGTFSFNHYAFGCVADFIVRRVVGLQVIEPGFKAFAIRPNINLGISEFHLRYESSYGWIEIKLDQQDLQVSIPQGSQATIALEEKGITEQVLSPGNYTFHLM